MRYSSLLIILLFFCTTNVLAAEPMNKETGLLVVVHGSPSPQWNEPIQQLKQEVMRSLAADTNPFLAAEVVNLEFKKPMTADGVKALAQKGCKRIVCMPLFIAHSSHVVYDIPAALGLFSSRRIQEILKEEEMEIAPSGIPIVMGPTLAECDLLLDSALQRVKELSTDPANEAIVILAHGDEGIAGTWNDIARRAACHACANTGITYADWAFVHVGQTYADNGLKAIANAAEHKKRILVIGLYLSMGAQRMHERYVATHGNPFENENYEVVFSPRGFLPDPQVAAWLVRTAAEIDQHCFIEGVQFNRLEP